MGDLSASDCSWKKMVIVKSNNKWFSTIKTDSINSKPTTMNTTNLSIGENSFKHVFDNIKKENDAESVEKNDEDYLLLVCDEDSDETAPMQIVDPLQTPQKRKRRISLGPKNETPEERAARLAKMSAYAARRLANETPDQRAQRLKRMSEYAAKRLAQETSEQRARRLARMSAYAAKRLASETPEQRQTRLTRMSAYAARRQAMKKVMNSPRFENTENNIDTDYITLNNLKPNQS